LNIVFVIYIKYNTGLKIFIFLFLVANFNRKVFIWAIFNSLMLNKFLREIVTIIVGKHVEEIADLLNNPKHVNEFNIAKKLDLTINQTRNVLYKISDQGLVSSIRKKDKRKGWYTYFWKMEISKSLEFLERILTNKISQIKNQVKSRETKEFYLCERCGIEFNEENALLHDFTCNECGGLFSRKDNSKILRQFKRNLGKLEAELELVRIEIVKEKVRTEKTKARGIKKEAKEKAEKRKLSAAKRKATREKNLKLKPKVKELKKGVPKKKKKLVKKKKPIKKKSIKGKLVKKKLIKKKKIVKKIPKKKVIRKKIVKKKPVKKKVVKKKLKRKK